MKVTQYWQIGNTGWRNPERLPQALKTLRQLATAKKIQNSKDFWDKYSSQDVLDALLKDQVLSVNPHSKSPFNGLQKALLSLREHGFIHWPGSPTEPLITPLGHQMILAQSKSAQQLVYAEALSQKKLPKLSGEGSFSPLLQVLKVAKALQKKSELGSTIFIDEMVFIMSSTSDDKPEDIAELVLDYRERKKDPAQGSDSKAALSSLLFKDELKRIRKSLSESISNPPSEESLRDYINVTLRHLMYTGLFNAPQHQGVHHLSLATNQKDWIDALLQEGEQNIWSDPVRLQTNIHTLTQEIEVLLKKMPEYKFKWAALSPEADLLELRTRYCDLKETALALKRGDLFKTISAGWVSEKLSEILEKKSMAWLGDEIIDVQSRRPALLEWGIYASLVACDNRPRESTDELMHLWRGSYDHQNIPSFTAPSQGEDAWVNLGSCVVSIETTTTSSDRQFAAEGESVQRHIIGRMLESNQPVYGLFIAPKLDLNVLGSFQKGWYAYGPDEKEFESKVIPLTLSQWNRVMTALVQKNQWTAKRVESFLEQAWKAASSMEEHLSSFEKAKAWRDTLEELVQSIELSPSLQSNPALTKSLK